jgi:peptide/nickel transport system substrate-binding protein
MSTKKWAWFALATLVGTILLTACEGVTPEVEGTKVAKETVQETVVEKETVVDEKGIRSRGAGDTVNLIYWQAASHLNPYLAGGVKEIDASALVLEPLARYDEACNLVPWLAEEIPTLENGGVSEDLISITWKIKPGILWSDGTPLTAEDAVFTAEYCLEPKLGCSSATEYADIESVEALDDLTVRLNFTVPKPFPYGPFVTQRGAVIQKAQFEDCVGAKAQQCTEENFNPIGTGAYKVEDFRANDVIVYQINENYRDPNKPFFKEVVIKGGGDAASAARAVLETGEADFAWNLQVEPEILNTMKRAGMGKVVTSYGAYVEHLAVNLTDPDPALGENRSKWTPDNRFPHPFLSDPVVRRALSLAIDRSILVQVGYGEAGQPFCNVVSNPAIYVSTANDECLVQNIELANQILDEAGWERGPDGIREKNGVRLSIQYQASTNSVRQGTQALIKQMWEQIGVETELRNIESAVFFGNDPGSPNTYGKFYADIEMYTNPLNSPDPELYMATYACSEIADESNQWLGNNRGRYCSEEYDELVAELAVTAKVDDRAELVKKMNDMLVQDYIIIPLIHRGIPFAHANSLEGVRLNLWDNPLWNIADWTRSDQ